MLSDIVASELKFTHSRRVCVELGIRKSSRRYVEAARRQTVVPSFRSYKIFLVKMFIIENTIANVNLFGIN